MRTLQNNFTTIEQSKRLLELGLPADSADCYYTNSIPHSKREDYYFLHILPFDSGSTISSLKEIAEEEKGFVIPCWSVGRLMEIFDICEIDPDTEFTGWANHTCVNHPTYIEYLINSFGTFIRLDKLDFSKLDGKS